MSLSTTDETQAITEQILTLYDRAWMLEKQVHKSGAKRPKSEIFLSREVLELLIELQEEYNNDGSNISAKVKQKKMNLIDKYIHKLHTSKHVELLTDSRNRSVVLLLIAIPGKQSIDCITYLVDQLQCDIHRIDSRGQNGYHIACEYINIAAIKLLYKYNVDITCKDSSAQQLTPLHLALDMLITSEKNSNSVNAHKYVKMATLCCQYALFEGQDMKNDRLDGNDAVGGQCWHFEKGQSILDIAQNHFVVLNVLCDAYKSCKHCKTEYKRVLLEYHKEFNEALFELLWSFLYHPLPKLGLKSKLKKAQQRIAEERIQRRQSMRDSINAKKGIKKKKKKTVRNAQ